MVVKVVVTQNGNLKEVVGVTDVVAVFLFFKENFCAFAEEGFHYGFARGGCDLLQDLFSLGFDVAAELILHFGSFGTGTGRKGENMAVEELDLF